MGLFKEFHKTNRLIARRETPHDVSSPIVKISGLSVRYNGQLALEGISFDLSPGERVAVVGPNGAGKSTLFKVIAGVLKPGEGTVDIYGHEPGGHFCIAYLPQRSLVDWNFPVSVADVVMMGRISQLGLLRQPRNRDWEKVNQALEVVRLADLSKRQISELSGGQQQRMFIARALAQEAELMLMDEPFSGLDANSQEQLYDIFEELRHRKVTVLVALHDLKVAAERFDRVILLNRLLLGFGRPQEIFTAERLTSAYGSHLRLVSLPEVLKAGTPDGTPTDILAVEDTCCDDLEGQHA